MNLRVASVCSGIGGAELAFEGLGEHVFAAETEAFPRAVLRHHFKDLRLYGDFRDIPASAGSVDVLVGGTPCQSFSVAGLRRGMADERGNLALEYLRLADRLRPSWLLWENVPGVLSSSDGRDFGAFVGGLAECGYGWAYRVLDAQHFGLAQRRKRVFVVGCAGDWRRAAAVLFEPASLRGDTAPRREAGQGVAPTLAPCIGASGRGFERTGDPRGQDCLVAFDARQSDVIQYGDQSGPLDTDGHSVAIVEPQTFGWQAGGSNDTSFRGKSRSYVADQPGRARALTANKTLAVAHSLRADGFDASEDGTGRGTPLVAQRSLVRRLTPTECERLMGVPDGYTAIMFRGKPAADGPRYRALGNAFAIPVVRWIARRIAREYVQ